MTAPHVTPPSEGREGEAVTLILLGPRLAMVLCRPGLGKLALKRLPLGIGVGRPQVYRVAVCWWSFGCWGVMGPGCAGPQRCRLGCCSGDAAPRVCRAAALPLGLL
ncbi:hypothetical protein GCM10020218_014950 [Dactylosporangium vinaceum]